MPTLLGCTEGTGLELQLELTPLVELLRCSYSQGRVSQVACKELTLHLSKQTGGEDSNKANAELWTGPEGYVGGAPEKLS